MNLSSHTVVVVHAHPDDEAIFTGVTVRRLADAGARVVVVTLTDGAAGVPRVRLAPGETLRRLRRAELERACELLGVARLELLPYADSGADGGPYPAGALGAAPTEDVAARIAAIAHREGAGTIVHDDPRGIYGHVDHVRGHRAGALAARRLGLVAYRTTVDRDAVRRGPRHVLQGAAGDDLDVGVPAGEVGLTVRAGVSDLLAKMAAMAAHASQIRPQDLDPVGFAAAYGREWFLRTGPAAGVLDALAAAPTGASRPGNTSRTSTSRVVVSIR